MSTLDEYLTSLIWRPITKYDREAGNVVLFRSASGRAAMGYYGAYEPWVPEEDEDEEEDDLPAPSLPDATPAFREAHESAQGRALPFEPSDFAVVDDHWRAELMAD